MKELGSKLFALGEIDRLVNENPEFELKKRKDKKEIVVFFDDNPLDSFDNPLSLEDANYIMNMMITWERMKRD